MRGTRLLLVMSLLVPVGVAAAEPAGAVLPHATCTKLSGFQTYTPALPKLGVATKVTATASAVANITGCTGGVASGTSTSKTTYIGNCTTLLTAKVGTVIKGTATIKWNTGKTSIVTTTLTTLTMPSAAGSSVKLVSKVTLGLFKGSTSTVTLKVTAPAGSCTATGLSKYTFVNSSKFVYS